MRIKQKGFNKNISICLAVVLLFLQPLICTPIASKSVNEPMEDFSWDFSAKEYEKLYKKALEKAKTH